MFCFVVRKEISDSNLREGALSLGAEKHIRTCSGCKRFLEQSRLLSEKLRSGNQSEEELSPFMHQRVMHGLKSEKPAPLWKSFPVRITAVGCVLLALSMFVLQSFHAQQQGENIFAQDDWGSLQPLETSLFQAEKIISGNSEVLIQPLSAEVQYLEEDFMAVAEKLDAHLNGVVFALVSGNEES